MRLNYSRLRPGHQHLRLPDPVLLNNFGQADAEFFSDGHHVVVFPLADLNEGVDADFLQLFG